MNKPLSLRTCVWFLTGMLCGIVLLSHLKLQLITWIRRRPTHCGASWRLLSEQRFSDDISVTIHQLVHSPKLFCLVLTYPNNYDRKAIHCQNTWVRRCDKYWFLGSKPHATLKLIDANVSFKEGRNNLWMKMKAIWPIVARVDSPLDYVYKADDDTYAVLENMRVPLAEQNANDPFMTGFHWQTAVPEGFFSGGAGYVLSMAAVRRFASPDFNLNKSCPSARTYMEDVRTTECARAAGVRTIKIMQDNGVSLLHPHSLTASFSKMNPTIELLDFYAIPYVRRSWLRFSPRHIGFHYINPTSLYTIEFITYHLRPVGVT